MNEKHEAYLEEQILKTLSKANYAFFELRMQNAYTVVIDDEDYEEDSIKTKFRDLVKKLYKLFVVYFESKGLAAYLADFKEDILPVIDGKYTLYSNDTSDENEDEKSAVINLLWQYLTPFEFVQGDMNELLAKYSGLQNLTKILTKKQPILNLTGIKPVNEAELYDILRIY